MVYLFFLRFIFIDFQRGEREGEKHQCVVASCAPPTGDLACNPGMCPDWELNQQPFGSQASTQSTEPHQPGLGWYIFLIFVEYVLVVVVPIAFHKLKIDFDVVHTYTHPYWFWLLNLADRSRSRVCSFHYWALFSSHGYQFV